VTNKLCDDAGKPGYERFILLQEGEFRIKMEQLTAR